jgi:holo-[acyl-carrier protein] synthase
VSSSIPAADRLAALVEPTLNASLQTTEQQPVGVGVDVVDLDAFERQLRVGGSRFLERLLIPAEIDYCAGRLEQLASRVAAKEAVVKALRCGFRGVGWHEVEVVTAANGAPSIRLHGHATIRAAGLGITHIHVSLAHEGRLAVAVAVATTEVGQRREPASDFAGGESR